MFNCGYRNSCAVLVGRSKLLLSAAFKLKRAIGNTNYGEQLNANQVQFREHWCFGA